MNAAGEEAVRSIAVSGTVARGARALVFDPQRLVGTLIIIGVITLAMTCVAVVTAGWWMLPLLVLGILLALPRPTRGSGRRRA